MSLEDFLETKENNVLIQIDEFEENIKKLNQLSKEYDKIKEDIKKQMLDVARNNNLEQVKWITPKGIKITLSKGSDAIFEDKTTKCLNEEMLKEKYPNIYEECCYEKTIPTKVKSASNDRLVITLPKEED